MDTATWLDPEDLAYPSGALRDTNRRARVLCSDGRFRTARVGVSDTFFSIPARLKVSGRTVSGYVTSLEVWREADASKLTDETPRETVYTFRQYLYGTNSDALPYLDTSEQWETVARRSLWIWFDSEQQFDAAESLNVLAHDFGLYAVKTSLDRLGFRAGMGRDTFRGLSEQGKHFYKQWERDAEISEPYEVPVWANQILEALKGDPSE